MGLWIGIGVVLLVLLGLGALGSRRRRSNDNGRLSRAPDGARAERHATGSTVTGSVAPDPGPSGF
ncbi:MAG TPA: hypothetical protein PLZ93_01495 [Nocardioides sp.]|uniref:hypothetical protein n=1 Tax=uncultured Nocardioides sp. TaxID=198441 RepID=UPI000EC6F751|nr:hypothetical protein [uncultured Nocardioides sp.]HCB06178.1 hypothetical protein [Nocardioides sp.]HRD60147.1 hypothetical protein [Nocardioides sp.]HRI94268.1 hypothetical protein [Nocardioides sp.]HRK45362.1 hypothetical protein [Nocardioides sp.]